MAILAISPRTSRSPCKKSHVSIVSIVSLRVDSSKITQNDSLQYKSSDCISETVKEIKLILIIKQGIEYNLQKLLPYPSIYKLLLSIPPTDF